MYIWPRAKSSRQRRVFFVYFFRDLISILLQLELSSSPYLYLSKYAQHSTFHLIREESYKKNCVHCTFHLRKGTTPQIGLYVMYEKCLAALCVCASHVYKVRWWSARLICLCMQSSLQHMEYIHIMYIKCMTVLLTMRHCT